MDLIYTFYRSPTDPKRIITKRIIALPGDMVQPLRKDEEVPIPAGHCWVEGDEAFHSKDSNSFGPVKCIFGNRLLFFFCNNLYMST